MFEQEIKSIIKYGELASKKDLTSGCSGNISCRCGENVLITATSTANGYLDENDFSVIDFQGKQIGGEKRPSSEKFLHLEYF